MTKKTSQKVSTKIETLNDLARLVDYSFVNTLNCDPDAKANGVDHETRQVFSGHHLRIGCPIFFNQA